MGQEEAHMNMYLGFNHLFRGVLHKPSLLVGTCTELMMYDNILLSLGCTHLLYQADFLVPVPQESYTNTLNYLAFVDFLVQRGTHSDYIKAHIQTAR